MLLTMSLSGPDARDLGFLLHKHPDRVQTFSLPVGEATVFYPEATDERCTAALLLDVDAVGLARRRFKSRDGLSPSDYVTDRPYAASSLLAVALGRVFGTALNGRCDNRPERAASQLPLTMRIPALPARGSNPSGAELVGRLFAPLGWVVEATQPDLGVPGWGPSPYVDLTLTGQMRLADALSQLFVLLPVLDNAKHYWVGSDEVDKLIRRGEGWLATHPERELITRRYLGVQRSFVADATARLAALDDSPTEPPAEEEEAPAPPLRLLRLQAVLDVLHEIGASRVADVGCGEGFYLRALAADSAVAAVLGVDVSARELERAERRLEREPLSDRQRAKVTFRQSSVTYRDEALSGFDALLLVEVVEHVEPDRLPSLEANVFGSARPAHVVVTTPNAEYNPRFGLAAGRLRHPDHRFEWSRAEFRTWGEAAAARTGYSVDFRPVGEVDADLGPPTQLALFAREEGR